VILLAVTTEPVMIGDQLLLRRELVFAALLAASVARAALRSFVGSVHEPVVPLDEWIAA